MTLLSKERCPLCSKPTLGPYRPFCSSRCQMIDLGNWLGEIYQIPTEAPLEKEEFNEILPS